MHRAKGNSGGQAVEKGDGEAAEGSVASRKVVQVGDVRDVLFMFRSMFRGDSKTK